MSIKERLIYGRYAFPRKARKFPEHAWKHQLNCLKIANYHGGTPSYNPNRRI